MRLTFGVLIMYGNMDLALGIETLGRIIRFVAGTLGKRGCIKNVARSLNGLVRMKLGLYWWRRESLLGLIVEAFEGCWFTILRFYVIIYFTLK